MSAQHQRRRRSRKGWHSPLDRPRRSLRPEAALSAFAVCLLVAVVFTSPHWLAPVQAEASAAGAAPAGQADTGSANDEAAAFARSIGGDTAANPLDVTDRASAAGAVALTRQGLVEFTIADLGTGRSIDQPAVQQAVRAASVIKTAIAVMALGRGKALSAGQRGDLKAAMEESDNGAAERLWVLGGGAAALTSLAHRLGMNHTTASRAWGFTTTTAGDLATLMAAVAEGRVLDPDRTAELLGLMRDVTPGERWGIPVAVGRGAPGPPPAVKNGWYPDTDQPVWRVNCLALVGPAPGTVLAIMTRYPQRLGVGYGEQTCALIASAVFPRTLASRG
jgi:hypothetical protein